jgi:beta-glucosidase
MGTTSGAFAPGGDRAHLTLHPEDEALIQAVAAVNRRTIVTMMGGSAIITEAWKARVPAIMMLWYPGMEGGHALADMLLGRVNPSGKLPCTFPTHAAQLPFFDRNTTAITYDLWHGYRKLERDGAIPTFPFGFGLSYTTYTYGDIHLAQTTLRATETLQVTLPVTNSGERAGEEVVQLYVAAQNSKVECAPKELKAFTRVTLAVGETRMVSLEVAISNLAYYDPPVGWRVEPIAYEVIIGRHALDPEARRARLAAAFGMRILATQRADGPPHSMAGRRPIPVISPAASPRTSMTSANCTHYYPNAICSYSPYRSVRKRII